MSDSNRVQLSYGVETAWGTHPGGTLIDVRYTGEGVKQDTNTVASQEIRADRNIPDLLRVGITGNGDVNFEMSHPGAGGFWLDFLRGALMSAAWSTPVTITPGTSLAISAASGSAPFTATLTRQAGSWLTDFSASTGANGRWIKLSGYSNSNNNVWVKIISIASATVCTILSPTALTNEAGTGCAATDGSYIRNGTTVPTVAASGNNSFTLEKRFQDLSSEFEIIKGAVVDRYSISVGADKIATAAIGFMAKNVVSASASGGSGYTAVGTAPVYSGVDNVQACMENQGAITLTEFTMQLQNNLRARLEIGQLGATSVGAGSCAVTGTFKAYYSSKAVMDRYLNGTATSIIVIFYDSNGNRFIADLPRVKFTAGDRLATGVNTDIYMSMGYQALYGSAAEPWTIQLARF